ncbi:MAG: type I secretion system permease/ATPase [gamma proteobacterium symbiont of Taylorina sp.]|nr:type I secretion system permease/ATPase [gamma proteobacterium symbiont of Taylorina sp.]
MKRHNNKTLNKNQIEFADIILQAKPAFLAVALFSLFFNLLMLTTPLYMLQVFDRVLSSHSHNTLLWLTVMAIIAFIFMSLLDVIRNRILGGIGIWLDRSLGTILVRSSLHKAAVHTSRGLPSSSLRDLSMIRNFLSGTGTLALIDSPWTPLFVIIIFLLHPWLGMLTLMGILTLILLTIFGELNARKRLNQSSSKLSQLYATIDSAADTADALVSMGALERIISQWKKKNHVLLNNTQQVNGKLASAVAVGKFVRLSLQILIMAVGALLVINEELTPGGMLASSILLTRALAPIEQLIGAWRAFVGSREAITRIVKQLNMVQEHHRNVEMPKPQGYFEANKISFALPSEQRFLFRDISFKLKPGEVLGIVGPSGTGKSTLARILVGLISPTTGHARVDGSDIAHWSLDKMGQYIGYLPQGFELFDGTIRQNISRFSDCAIEDVIHISKLAGIHDFIVRLPKGYETKIIKNSVFLSGGQQQRIALARAIFGYPSIIVMDEPNANLDPSGEKALLKAIDILKRKGKTIILIAHRSNILRSADQLLMMNHQGGKLLTRKNTAEQIDQTLGVSYQYIQNIIKDIALTEADNSNKSQRSGHHE